MATVLVTGGNGYIGSRTVISLFESGYDVVIADNLANSKMEVQKRLKMICGKDFKFYKVDCCDEKALSVVFEENRIDSVIHFAGLKAVGESVRIPLDYYSNNIGSAITVCRLMKKYGVKDLVFSSSATVYGMSEDVPFTEESPVGICTNPYGWTKWMIEQILRDFAVSEPSMKICLLRYFNPVGAHESGLIGEDPRGIPNNLFPYISKVAGGTLEKLTVFVLEFNIKSKILSFISHIACYQLADRKFMCNVLLILQSERILIIISACHKIFFCADDCIFCFRICIMKTNWNYFRNKIYIGILSGCIIQCDFAIFRQIFKCIFP